MLKTLFVLLSFAILTQKCFAQLQQLKLSSDRHNLVTKDGKPFFWLGDTGWELFHRLDKQSAEAYFKKRSEQGFTVIQAVVLAELDGLHTPNANGDLPLMNDDPLKPNEPYFKYVDTLIELAGKSGLYIALLPTWGDKVFNNTWERGPEIYNTSNAYDYGK